MLPKNSGGVIVRTVGEDVTQETFQSELTTLISQWGRINKKTKFVGKPPKLLHRETSLTRGIIRDLFSTKIDSLTVDSKQVYNEIVEYLKGIAPELADRVHLYEDKKGSSTRPRSSRRSATSSSVAATCRRAAT